MKVISVALAAGFAIWTPLGPALAADGAKTRETVLHSFGGGTDGQKPFAGLTDLKGVLFGTIIDGGAQGDGTVFALDPKTGKETVLYSFCSQQNCMDGSELYGNLVAVKGRLYGTTFEGGSGEGGTIYMLDPKSGTVAAAYSFCGQENCTDGSEPLAGLIELKGLLYGTTFDGGAHGFGSVFSFDPETGAEKVIYSFCSLGNCADGDEPISNLLAFGNMLYGTTPAGGAHTYGTVFSVDPETGVQAVLYSFCSQQACTDGGPSEAGLIALNGTLYGTTYTGGANDMGTVFAVDPVTDAQTVVYSFCGQQSCADGAASFSGLFAENSVLYGITTSGGVHNGGTVFSLDPLTGEETVLYSFCSRQNCDDGIGSDSSLIGVKGKLYGTTFYGGANDLGTAFELKR